MADNAHIIDFGRIHVIHIVNPSEAHRCGEILVEAVNRASRVVQILRVARYAPGVEV